MMSYYIDLDHYFYNGVPFNIKRSNSKVSLESKLIQTITVDLRLTYDYNLVVGKS